MAPRGPSRLILSPSPSRIAGSLALAAAPVIVAMAFLQLPWSALESYLAATPGARITDRTGSLLGLLPGRDGSFQERLSESDIPPAAREIFVTLEDARFRSHPGVDLLALARAVRARLPGGGARSGASTITMQLARMVSPHARTPAGKIGESLDALRIEARLSKDQILTAYLNEIPFGHNARGIGAAAWIYFASDLSALSRGQLLALAVIPRNPTRYDPFDHPDALIAAASEVSVRRSLGIGDDEIERAVLGAASARPPGAAPHFVRLVASTLANAPRGSDPAPGGEARTTLDLGLNRFIEARVRFYLARYEAARVTNAAVVAIENETGAVLGWVGSRDFSDAAHAGQIDGVLTRRQSASTLKPFLYAGAIARGWTAATLLPDAPLAFGADEQEAYRPENFDKRSHGAVRLRTALASSLNVPAVYALSHLGLPTFLETLGKLGFRLPADARARWGLGAAIGNAEVSLVELALAFTVFPRGGTLPALRLLEGQQSSALQVFDPFSAWMICDILSDPSARATGFGTRTYFRTSYPAMFKSGTSSEFTNLWCVGATPRFTVAAWAGNFDGRAVINKTGSIVPAQIVVDVLDRLTEAGSTQPGFEPPSGVVEARICAVSGQRATPSCPSTRKEFFRSANEVPDLCAYHASAGDRASLLLESFLAPSQRIRILFPVNGQVFYLDQTAGTAPQGVPVVIAARRGLEVAVGIDGAVPTRVASLSQIRVPLRRGAHHVVVRSGGSEERVTFEVR